MTDLALDRLASANQIRRRLADFARQMRALRAAHGVSASKLSVLGRLLRAGLPLSATQLARLEKLQPQSLTRIIAELDADGFIVRRQNESDRRHLDIEISEKGRELLVRDALRQNQWLAGAMEDKLSPAERAVLALAVEMLERLGGPDPTINRGS
jgi:DNA-binding MarR family transcriptional regulator